MTETFQLLTEAQRALLIDERVLLTQLRTSLARHGAPQPDLDALDGSIRQLDDLFLLVVVGEFNAGKSAFINALVGQDVCQEGVTPTTSRITVLRHADARSGASVDVDGVSQVAAPIELLRTLHIVDTPGTNAVMREHEALTQRFVPRADLVLFLTSSDRPFTESERAFLERIRDWGKKVVVIVNKVDILEGQAQVDQVLTFVADQSRRLLGIEPPLFAVSSRLAKQGGRADAEQWRASGFSQLEAYLEQTLDDAERVRLKLRNPLGVGERAAASLAAELQGRVRVLDEDVSVLTTVEQQIETHSADVSRDFEYRMADIDKLLVEMEARGHEHFDRTLRLTRVPELLDRGRVQRRFEEEVVADTPQRIERKVNELIDWLVDSDLRQWHSVNDRLAERRVAHRERLGSQAAGGFHVDRARLLDSVGRDAQRVVETYDRADEARAMAEKARSAVTTSAAIEVGAAGLGAVVAAVASTAAADLTGLAMAGVIATLGLLVIPNRRHRAKQELRDKVSAIRERLSRSLRSAFEDEQVRSRSRLQQGIEPYSTFVSAERDRLSRAQEELATIRGRIAAIGDRISALA